MEPLKQLPVVLVAPRRPTIDEQNRHLKNIRDTWNNTIYITDSKVKTLEDGTKVIESTRQKTNKEGATRSGDYLSSFFARGFSGEVKAVESQIKELIEEHKKIYRENLENIDNLTDKEIQTVISNQLLINSIIEIARTKFPHIKEVPQEQKDLLRDKFHIQLKKALRSIIDPSISDEVEKMKHVLGIQEQLLNGKIPQNPEYQAFFNFLPVLYRFQRAYPNDFGPESKYSTYNDWHLWIESIKRVDAILNRGDNWTIGELDTLANEMQYSRLASFISANEKPESSFFSFYVRHHQYMKDFLENRKATHPEFFATLPTNRLIEILHDIPYKDFPVTPEQFTALLSHEKTRKLFHRLNGWNLDTWKQLLRTEAFVSSPHFITLLKEDRDFYLFAKTQVVELQNSSFLKALAQAAFEVKDEAIAAVLELPVYTALLSHENLSAETKKWVYEQAEKGPAGNDLKKQPILLLKYAPRQKLQALDALLKQYGADHLRAGLGMDVEKLDPYNSNIARLVPSLYPNWLMYRGLLLAVPAMDITQFRTYMETSPVIRDEEQRMLLATTANEVPPNEETLIELLRYFPQTAKNLMNAAKMWEHSSEFWAAAFKVIPATDAKELVGLIKERHGQPGEYSSAANRFVDLLRIFKVDAKRIGKLLIELGVDSARTIVEKQKHLDKKLPLFAFYEEMLSEFAITFAQKLKLEFDPLRNKIDSLKQWIEENKISLDLADDLSKILPEDAVTWINPSPRQIALNQIKEMREFRNKLNAVGK